MNRISCTAKVKISILVNKPVETVFEFMADPENDILWQSGVLESRRTSQGPMGVGTTEESESQFLGRRFKSTYDVTAYEPNREIGNKTTSGLVAVKVAYLYEALDGGQTKVTFVLEGDAGSFFKLAEPILVRMTQRQWETNLAALKDILETRTVGVA